MDLGLFIPVIPDLTMDLGLFIPIIPDSTMDLGLFIPVIRDLIRHTLLDVDTEFKPYQLNLTRVWDLIRHTLLDVGKGLIERLGCFVLS